MNGINTDVGRTTSMPQSTLELISLMGKSMRSSWKRYLGAIIGFAVLAFFVNVLLIQYDALLKDMLSQYLSGIIQIIDPVIQVLNFDLAFTYNNIFPSAVLWLLIGFILAIMREQGVRGLKKIPGAIRLSAGDIKTTGIKGLGILFALAIISFLIGIQLNNIVLIFACIISILYTLAARQTGVLLMALRLIWSDIRRKNRNSDEKSKSNLISLGYPVSVLSGIFLGFLVSFFYQFIQLL
jgi:hypothetical protein